MRARLSPMARGYLSRAAEECAEVSAELRVLLKQEAVRRVRINLDLSIRDQAREQVRVMRQDHGVAVAVGHQHGHVDGAHSLQQRVIRDPPGTDGVILGLACFPGRCLVSALSSSEHALQDMLAGLPARRRLREKYVEVLVWAGFWCADRADDVCSPAVHSGRTLRR